MNLGPRPTFGEGETKLEAHLFDADGDFYGMRVRLDFLERLRETQKFASAARSCARSSTVTRRRAATAGCVGRPLEPVVQPVASD